MNYVIALDVGGTAMKAALVAPDGAVLFQARRPTMREQGPDAVVAAIRTFTADLADEGHRRFGAPPSAAGVVVPGTVDEQGGIASYSVNLGWRDVPLRSVLARHLAQHTGNAALPIALGHDVRAGALAEARLGAGREVERFLFLALGTGIAGAIVLGGHVDPGTHRNAGEIGHSIVVPDGPACGCGASGCLETLASAGAVSRAWALASADPTADARDCAHAVEAGDHRAAVLWHRAVDALACGIVQAHNLLDVSAVVVGGGLAEAGDTLFAPLRSAVRRRLTFQVQPAIVPAALKDTAGALGAALLAWDLAPAGAVNRGR